MACKCDVYRYARLGSSFKYKSQDHATDQWVFTRMRQKFVEVIEKRLVKKKTELLKNLIPV